MMGWVTDGAGTDAGKGEATLDDWVTEGTTAASDFLEAGRHGMWRSVKKSCSFLMERLLFLMPETIIQNHNRNNCN